MKPFIAPEISDTGKKVLRIQWEGVDEAHLWELFQDSSLIAFSMPKQQSFKQVLPLYLLFDNGTLLELSSAYTQVMGWEEYGSLNVCLRYSLPAEMLSVISISYLPAFQLKKIEKLLYENDEIISECGLVLGEVGGSEIVVAAGISPGSVTVSAPFSHDEFDPEVPIELCRRAEILNELTRMFANDSRAMS